MKNTLIHDKETGSIGIQWHEEGQKYVSAYMIGMQYKSPGTYRDVFGYDQPVYMVTYATGNGVVDSNRIF